MAATPNSYDFLDPPSEPSDLGTLAHYRVIDELGKGGMGYVFRAEDAKLKRSVALKVMNKKIAATTNSRERFLSEARAMAAVHHDNVVTIFEVGESSGTPFMAMEMLRGCSLETFNKGATRLGYEKIIDYAIQIARGLAAAHANGIVHRDIKPANIWIVESIARIKILDFGLALASTPVDQMAGVGAVIGTPGYLSPEQARSDPLDDRSDLYSLGVVLYELCTGRWPIREITVAGQLIAILAHQPRPVQELNRDIPQPLCDLVHRLLRKEPRTRPSSAKFLEQELQRVKVECHAKSEVAQAISKLQMGLSEVVNKRSQSAEMIFDVVEEVPVTVAASFPDPLASIPAPITMMPPARPVVKKRPEPAWKTYWPIAAGIGVALIAIPLLAFALIGSGDEEVATIASSTQTTSQSADQNDSNSAQSDVNQRQRSNDQGQSRAGQNDGGQNKPGQKEAGRKPNDPVDRGKPNQAGPNASGGQPNSKPQGRPNPPKANPAKTNPNKQNNDPNANPAAASSGSPPTATVSSGGAKVTSPGPLPVATTAPLSPAPPVIETEWTTIATSDGRGADAIVQKGASAKLGIKPTIGVGARKGVETYHSYLRFDLAGIEEVKSHVKSAKLVLTVIGGRDAPLTAFVRVIGIPDVGLWPEEVIEWQTSFSETGLESFPVLAETTVTAENALSEEGRYVISLSSPKLSQFIASSSGDTVTFALAGSGPIGGSLRFASRENSAQLAPKLLLETPKDPPPTDEKK